MQRRGVMCDRVRVIGECCYCYIILYVCCGMTFSWGVLYICKLLHHWSKPDVLDELLLSNCLDWCDMNERLMEDTIQTYKRYGTRFTTLMVEM